MVWAANCSGTTADACGTGCVWDKNTCSECPAGFYCPNNQTKTQCPQNHPNSVSGSTKDTDCYKTCTNQPIENGEKVPKTQTVNYPTDCTYTISCDNGYHEENSQCVLSSGNCSDKLGNCTNGAITGTWNWNSTTTTNDYNNCKCTKNEANNGSQTKNCTYNSGTGNSTKWDCTTTVNSCDKGYYKDNTTCTPCPIGSTSDGFASASGASAKTDCYITGGTNGTEFCDKDNNCFTLPAGTKLNAN